MCRPGLLRGIIQGSAQLHRVIFRPRAAAAAEQVAQDGSPLRSANFRDIAGIRSGRPTIGRPVRREAVLRYGGLDGYPTTGLGIVPDTLVEIRAKLLG
ncbi:hypothetical protein MYSE111917_01580 [Mycobacterium senriense]|uniref:Uncharacterized protein n=1 Tax=Mycobacterium senriense TaxID=2775496 RepID=A0ABM7SLE2_9MYCO|nr:hypothetical protein MTY59_18270 [Mycobacterium senriense]